MINYLTSHSHISSETQLSLDLFHQLSSLCSLSWKLKMNICFQVGKSQRYEGGSDGACDEASGQWSVPRNRLISFLQKSGLECPVCLETARGEIFCCVEPLPSHHHQTPVRREECRGNKRLGEELERIVVELTEVVHQPSAPSL